MSNHITHRQLWMKLLIRALNMSQFKRTNMFSFATHDSGTRMTSGFMRSSWYLTSYTLNVWKNKTKHEDIFAFVFISQRMLYAGKYRRWFTLKANDTFILSVHWSFVKKRTDQNISHSRRGLVARHSCLTRCFNKISISIAGIYYPVTSD